MIVDFSEPGPALPPVLRVLGCLVLCGFAFLPDHISEVGVLYLTQAYTHTHTEHIYFPWSRVSRSPRDKQIDVRNH